MIDLVRDCYTNLTRPSVAVWPEQQESAGVGGGHMLVTIKCKYVYGTKYGYKYGFWDHATEFVVCLFSEIVFNPNTLSCCSYVRSIDI